MAAAVRKKQEDRNLKALRELGALSGNRECFDCGQRGPTYINMTIGSFVCSQCSGVLRGLTPPHRVKSISMATFTQEELDFIKAHGNEECSKTWLGLLSDPKQARAGKQPHQDSRDHIIDKYEKQRFYLQPASPLKSIGAAAAVNGMRNGGSSSLSSSSTTSPSSPSSSSVNSAADQNNNNNNNVIQQQQNQLNLKAIQLTPPTSNSSRTSGRHHHSTSNNNNSSSLSRGINGTSAFAEDSLFSEVATKQQVLQAAHPQQQWANLNNNNNSLFSSPGGFNNGNSNAGAVLSSALSGLTMAPGQQQPQKQQQQTTNGSGGFVADFGSADIFNANVINGGGQVNGGGGLQRKNAVKRRNGQVMSEENGFMNGNANGQTTTKPEENFADFDHNPIFNAADYNMEQQQQSYQNVHMFSANNSNGMESSSNSSRMLSMGGAPGLFNGGGGSNTTIPFNYFPAPAPIPGPFDQQQPIYSNIWQQHQQQQWNNPWYQASPFISPGDQQIPQQNYQNNNQFQMNLNQNRWSVPMSMSSSNSSTASTPSADRYAALKYLDEQIREIKEKEIIVQQQPPPTVTPFSNPNPFKAAYSPPAAAATTTTSFPTSGTNPFKMETNGFSTAAPQPQQPQFQPVQFNGFGSSINGFQNGVNMYGIGLNATGGGQKSNNPFL